MIKEITSKTEWDNTLSAISEYDFYHTYDYHSLSVSNEEKFILLTYVDGKNIIAVPLILRPINDTPYYDFTSIYGYGGPITNIIDTDYDYSTFSNELNSYFISKNVITVFSRLHPYIQQDHILYGLGNIDALGEVVNIDLNLTLEKSRQAYSKSNKNQINKLRRSCSIRLAETEEDILEFVDIYHENMRRLNANDYYFFDKYYFLEFMKKKDFKTDLLLVQENDSGKFIAGSMFVKTKNIVQFHLSGTRTDYLRMKPSKLFIDEMRLIAKEEGCTYFNLGGGLKSERDTLFDFKASFSKDFKKFKVWKHVVNNDVYNKLPTKAIDTDFFPKYRYGN